MSSGKQLRGKNFFFVVYSAPFSDFVGNCTHEPFSTKNNKRENQICHTLLRNSLVVFCVTMWNWCVELSETASNQTIAQDLTTFCVSEISFVEIKKVESLTKSSLSLGPSKTLAHDWMSPDNAKTFRLDEFYTHLRWTRKVKRALMNTKETMPSIFALLGVAEAGNILVEGTCNHTWFFYSCCDKFELLHLFCCKSPPGLNCIVIFAGAPGMGKTSSMSFLAMSWANQEGIGCKFLSIFVHIIAYMFANRQNICLCVTFCE